MPEKVQRRYIFRYISRSGALRLIKDTCKMRVSESAAQELSLILEDIGVCITKEAVDYAKHSRSNKLTVKDRDLRAGAKRFLRK